jgi:DNA gyrase subunit B
MRPLVRWEIVTSEYSAHHLQVLEGLEAVRKRPGMYIGSNGSPGLMHCLWEIIDNAVDETLGGNGSKIDVVLHGDGSVEVRDKGRGIPVDVEPRTGLSGVEVVFTKLHAGGKFGGGSYAASGGLHGVGASVVNALSERLDVEVDRGGKTWAMSFHRGEPGLFADKGEPSPSAPFTPFDERSELRVVGKAPRGVTGTRVRYWADKQIFTPDAAFQVDELATRARQTAFLVPGLEIAVRDERAGVEPTDVSYRFDGGISEFVEFLAPDAPITDTWRLTGTGTFTETVPVLQASGTMVATEVERTCSVDIALRWGTRHPSARHRHPLVRQHHLDAQGWDAPAGLRAGGAPRTAPAGRGERPAPQGRQRQARQGRRPRRDDRRADGEPARAAVRGPDEGSPRHPRGPADRRAGRA